MENQNEVPAWAQALIDQNKALAEKVTAIKAGSVSNHRRNKLKNKLEGTPDKFKSKILKDFERMGFEKDEDFENYLTETETDIADIKQDLSNQGLRGIGTPKESTQPGNNGSAPNSSIINGIVDDLMK